MIHSKKRSDRLRLTATWCSVCLLAGAIAGSLAFPLPGHTQSPPPLSAEQQTDLQEAERLNEQAWQLYEQGKYAEAVPLAERALAIRKRILGDRHPDVATSLNNLAFLYESQGRYGEAEPLYKQALQLRKQLLGDRHRLVASSLNNLAVLYRSQGRYGEAEPLFKQALELMKQLLGDRHPHVATGLHNLAFLYESQGRYREAELLFKQALELTKQLLGERHPDVAASLGGLAGLYQSQGRYGEAEPLYKQALELYKQRLGERHPLVASSLNNLAGLYRRQGRYGEAEPLLKQALALRKQLLGDRHPDVAASLGGLAALYNSQGRYGDAEPLYKQALQLRKQLLGERHPDVAVSLHNLAFLYANQGRYREAEPLYKQALELTKQLLGERHPDVAQSLNNLAGLYESQGRYGEAEPLYKQALQLRKQLLGDRHPDVLTSLNNLAGLYANQGRYGEAEPFYKQALQLRKQLLGNHHPDVAYSLNNLAALYESQGRYGEAIAFLTQGLNTEEANLMNNLAIGAEAQKQDYIATFQWTTDAVISLHLQRANNNSEAARLALTTILRRKGRILEALSDNLTRLRQNLTAADQDKLDQLAAVRTQLSALYYGGLGNRTPEQYRDQITQLQQQATQLEADLNNRSAEFRSATQPVDLASVQAQIPADVALVELVQYEPFNPKAKLADRWGKPRYAAYILSSQGTIQAVDLGDAAAIDPLAEQFRQALRTRESDVKAIARQLDAKLMQPIRAKLGNTRKLLISPDSQLNLIPFAALVDEQNRYLVETYEITYLTSGRDLLRLQTNRVSAPLNPPALNPLLSQGDRAQSGGERSRTAILLANPDYANPGDPTSARKGGFSNPIVATTANSSVKPAPTGNRGINQRSSDLAKLQFGPLPGTAAEASAIAPKLPGVTLLTGSHATENALKQMQSPKILHIATHGFFLEDIPLPAPTSRGLSGDRSDLIPTLDAGFRPPTRPGNTENALLRSGLALAGFNRRQSGTEDGVLTALEAAGLNLRGTKLVVLSACETGIGDVANGEGVYGLRRAFVLAGAESQLISLWKVDDQGTKDLMVQYYDKLLAKAGRSDALRQTQLAFLNDPNYRHPYYWAAFIPSGDWRALGD